LTLKLFYNQENLSQYKKIQRLVVCPGLFSGGGAYFRVAGVRRKKKENILQVKSYLLSYRCKDRQQQQPAITTSNKKHNN